VLTEHKRILSKNVLHLLHGDIGLGLAPSTLQTMQIMWLIQQGFDCLDVYAVAQ